MIVGIGIDTVEIKRCTAWTTIKKESLFRVFNPEEINYAFSNPKKTLERLAVRFAAKEAFYKAVSPLVKDHLPFLTVCKAVHVRNGRFPRLDVQWKLIQNYLDHHNSIMCLLSLTHSTQTASAVVVLQDS